MQEAHAISGAAFQEVIPELVLNSWSAAFLFAGEETMKEKKHRCKNCKWLEDLPFTDTYVCGNPYSSYDQLECDVENDSCEAWESEEKK